MTINISQTRTIMEVQKDFNNYFPYLKIEFFKKENGKEKASPLRILAKTLSMGEIRLRKEEGNFEIWPEMTVAELEKSFWDRYGLSVQVFRKSGNLWLETTMTDKWTLSQQNNHGQEISQPVRKNEDADLDYELNRGED